MGSYGRPIKRTPGSNCSRCFALNPPHWYTHVITISAGATKFKFKTDVPLCSDCRNQVRLANISKFILTTALLIGSIILYFNIVIPILESDKEFSGLAFFAIILIPFLVLLISSIVIGMALPNYLLDAKFVEYYDVKGQMAKIRFKNKDYQALYTGTQNIPNSTDSVRSLANIYDSFDKTKE